MTKSFRCLLLGVLCLQVAFAQQGKDSPVVHADSAVVPQKPVLKKDSSASTDTTHLSKDSIPSLPKDSVIVKKSVPATPGALALFTQVLKHNPWFNFLGKSRYYFIERHKDSDSEGLFYLLTGIFLYFALIRLFFTKYLGYLVSLFLRASLRQQQIREQLLQTPLPSLLLNLLFVISGGLYVCFLARYYQLAPEIGFWLLLADCCVMVGAVYVVKFLVLKTAGWIFNIEKAADTYIFIVFMVNKILGIVLLPLLAVLFFSVPAVRDIVVIVSFFVLGFLLLYRFIASYPSIRNEIKISIFYFFLYLCAFEIAPLLLIYKVLLTYLGKAY